MSRIHTSAPTQPRRSRRSVALAMSVALGSLAAPASLAIPGTAAHASFPGTNGHIAYVGATKAGLGADIFTVRRDGTGVQRLTFTGDAFSPRWSPDGGRILYWRNRLEAGTQVWVMGPSGSHKRLLLSSRRGARFPAWSPDARRIVFRADGARGTLQLFIYRLGTHTITKLTHAGRRGWSADQPVWSPRGGRIAFFRYTATTAPELFTVRVDGTGLHRLTHTAAEELAPDWSPDGARIAYTRSKAEAPCDSDVYVINANGTSSRKLLDRGCDDMDPSWAPNGKRIVLSSNQSSQTPGFRKHSGLWTVRPDGTRPRLLLRGGGSDPDWQPR